MVIWNRPRQTKVTKAISKKNLNRKKSQIFTYHTGLPDSGNSDSSSSSKDPRQLPQPTRGGSPVSVCLDPLGADQTMSGVAQNIKAISVSSICKCRVEIIWSVVAIWQVGGQRWYTTNKRPKRSHLRYSRPCSLTHCHSFCQHGLRCKT